MKLSVEKKISLGFGMALVALLAINVMAYRSARGLLKTLQEEERAQRFAVQIDVIFWHLLEADARQRAFILSGEERHLETYSTAACGVDYELNEFRRLLAADRVQPHRVALLSSLIERQLAGWQGAVELRKAKGAGAPLPELLTDEAEELMAEIRAVVTEIKRAEHVTHEHREARELTNARAAILAMIFASLAGAVLVVVAGIMVYQDVVRRLKAEQMLQSAYSDLKIRVAERTAELARANEELRLEIAQRSNAETRLEEALTQMERSRDDLLSVLDQLQLSVAIADESGKVIFLSRSAQRLFGMSQETALGKHWETLLPFRPDDKEQIRQMAARPAAERVKVPAEMETSKDRHYWMEVEVQDVPREPRNRIFFFYDVCQIYNLKRLGEDNVQFQNLFGNCKAMQTVYQQIREVASVDSTVLIDGETGTGKELVARAIHCVSHRKDHPFIAVNTAGLASSLLHSQLFGHKRGAFTGAIADHQGLFEAAGGGIIFLDEIGDMPLEVQTALLRVLQEREFTRLGESKPRKANVRVLVATHHNLNKDVEAGRFRADLFYRIRVARIQLPPLCERREDIPLLVAEFLRQSHAMTGKPVHAVSNEAMRILWAYSWPGNVRELKSAIEFACIHCTGSVIQATDLPAESHGAGPSATAQDGTNLSEKERLLLALRQARGNRTEAAQLLGISRATLYRRLGTLGINHEDAHST